MSLLTPDGWRGTWFAAINRQAVRYNALATWERITVIGGRAHDFTLSGEVAMRRLRGTVTEGPIVVANAVGHSVGRILRGVHVVGLVASRAGAGSGLYLAIKESF